MSPDEEDECAGNRLVIAKKKLALNGLCLNRFVGGTIDLNVGNIGEESNKETLLTLGIR